MCQVVAQAGVCVHEFCQTHRWPHGGMEFPPILGVLQFQIAWFILGCRWCPALWLRGPPHRGILEQHSGYLCLKSQLRARIRS